MSWLAKLTGMFRPNGLAYDPHADFETRSLYGMQIALQPDNVRYVLSLLRYCEPTDANVCFVTEALRDGGNGMQLRTHGKLMDPDTLAENGMRRNVKCSVPFYAMLNDRGRSDPINAARAIASMIGEIAAKERNIANTVSALGKNCKVEVIPNTMAAGPCHACTDLAKAPIPIQQAPRCALPSCPHPEQCYLHFRSVLAFD